MLNKWKDYRLSIAVYQPVISPSLVVAGYMDDMRELVANTVWETRFYSTLDAITPT